MIDTILFDLNKVIVGVEHSIEDEQCYQKTFGIDKKAFRTTVLEGFPDYNLGLKSFDELLSEGLFKLGLAQNLIGISKVYHEQSLCFVKGIENILLKLVKNYRLILLAGDGKESLKLKVRKFGLDRFFDKIYATCDIAYNKNTKEYYQYVLEHENLNLNNVIFIDDRINYLKTAKSLGINGILFKDSQDLLKEFKKLGICV